MKLYCIDDDGILVSTFVGVLNGSVMCARVADKWCGVRCPFFNVGISHADMIVPIDDITQLRSPENRGKLVGVLTCCGGKQIIDLLV